MKLLKQAGTVVIASSLLLGMAPAAFADTVMGMGSATASTDIMVTAVPPVKGGDTKQLEAKLTKEQALDKVKTYITLPDGYAIQNVSLNAYYGGNGTSIPTWNINYAKKVKDRNYGYISVSINGMDGSLTSYSFNDNDPDRKISYPPKVDYAGAKDIAAAFVAKVNPAKQGDLLYNDADEQSFRTPLDGNYQYNIRYDRAVNGVPFNGNGISVNVNGEGQVVNYYYNWDDNLKFETATPISKEKAADLVREKSSLSLQYQVPYRAQDKKVPIISYILNPTSLNAATGEVWTPAQGLEAGDGKTLTDKPLGSIPASNLNLTKEEAIKKVTDTFGGLSDYTMQEASFNESTNPDTGEVTSNWSISWNKPVTDSTSMSKIAGGNAWASVNSKTGEIISFSMYSPYDYDSSKPVEGKVSIDDAIAKSNDLVKKQLPGYTDQLALRVQKSYSDELLKQLRTWDINYVRTIDGVTAGYEGVRISIDRVTGEIRNYNVTLSNLPYPKQKPEVISEDKAKDLWLGQYDLKLSYVLDGGYYGAMPIEKYRVMMAAGEVVPDAVNSQDKGTAKLVYSLNLRSNHQAFLLDAATGQWRNADTGEVMTLGKVTVSDIDQHWAKNELQLMLDYQALDVKDGKVNPDEAITKGELVKMLVIAMNGGNGGIYYGAERAASFADVANGSKYFAYVENAVDRGLLDAGSDFNADAKMDRESMAQLIVKALGYKNLAKYEGVFNPQIADSAQLTRIGDAAIVVGLGIMSLSDGSFAPKTEVTKAQAASAFYRFLQRRAELQEQPRYY
ncbi:YcdB/YcdC domain-containing protein [Paenibacillus ferrarius]